MKRWGWAIVAWGIGASGGCQPGSPASPLVVTGSVPLRPGVEPTVLPAAERVMAGQSVFVPIYSSIATADNARAINLAVTLTVRNLDQRASIVVPAIRYHDSGGQLIRNWLDRPLRVGPLASLDLFLRESDNSGGPSPSFLVDWVAESEVVPPIVEAVMISTAGSLGVTFTSSGRVIGTRHR